jgi:hypothetical protein
VARLFRGRRRPSRPRTQGARVEALESRHLLNGSWGSYAGNPQHTALSTVPSDSLDGIAWQTPVDLDPQYSGGDLAIHYGSPLVTAADTVIVPVKTGATGGFEVVAFSGTNGTAKWTLPTDYLLPPHNWTPSYSPVLTPGGRLYFAGAGGTVYYTNAPDSTGATISGHLAFYGISNYTHAGFDNSVYISTPITSDANGDIFFGFQVTGSNPLNLQSGIARIGADGTGTLVAATAAAGDGGLVEVPQNCAPALSNDGRTLYIAVSSGSPGRGDLLALNSTTLATLGKVALIDPASGNNATIVNDGTASPTVGPDGDVYYGVLENPSKSNNDRGWLLHFSGDLAQTKIPGAFGWDDTASIVPASMVPSYSGASSYLLMTKYNNYAGLGTGNGLNKIAILDPNATEKDPVTGASVMKEVETILGPTPDPDYDQTYPGAVREWCINTAAVDPATDSVLANSEDGTLFRWDLATDTFSQRIVLTTGEGEAYTPTVIGADGAVYAIQDATLYQIKGTTNPTPTPTPTSPPNQPPVLAAIPDQTVDEGVELTVPVTASDPDGDAITYGLGPGAPAGAAIGPNTGLFTWTPDPYASTGTYSITVIATDSASLTASEAFTVHVLPVNHPPVLSPIPSQLAEQGQPTEVRVARYASDPDRPPQTLTYSLASNAPAGSILDPVSGIFAWTVPPDQTIGAYVIGVTVTDDGSPPMSTSGYFVINVVPFNHPPVVAPIPAQTVDEGSLLTVDVTATDPDAGQTLTYSLAAGAPAGAAIDPHTGVFTWTPDPYASSGNYAITVVATDNGPIPKSGSATFAVDVLAVNHPPVFAAVPAQSTSPGRTLQFGVAGFASDRDRPAQTLTYSLAPGDPAGATIDPASGLFTWTVPPSQHIGPYTFGVIVTDDGSPPLSATTSFVVDVFDSGPAPTVAKAKANTRRVLTITLRFSQPLDASTASNLDDYILVPARKKKAAAPASIPLAVSYDPATRTVTLVAQAKVRRGQALRLTVIGSGPNGLAKVTGLPLAGDGRHPGTNYVATITGGRITHASAAAGKTRSKVASGEG